MTRDSTVRVRRAMAVTAGLAAAALALSGCIYAQIPSGPNLTAAEPDTSGVPENLMSFYTQTVTWEMCGIQACTTIEAPLDWENPEAGTLDLAVVRNFATSGQPMGSMLINPGGPGASGYDFVAESVSYAVSADIIENYDVIGWDPRGVGRSTPVTCLSDAEMDDYLYSIPENPRGSDAWTAELEAANKVFADACEANSDGILQFITTINSARDMDLIRALTGDTELDYLGYSYGTFLGATYAELYPNKVGRLVLDGAVDPATSGYDVGSTQALGFESALRAFFENCLQSGDCPFNGTVDNAMADLGALLASVDRAPLPSGDGRSLGADSLLTGIISALYAEQAWSSLQLAITEVLQGKPENMLQLADFYNGRNPDGSYADNSTEAFRAYNCMDYPAEDDPAAEAAAEAKIAAGAPTIAPYWNGPDSCKDWPYPPSGERGEIHAEGAPPIIVLGTTNDPATPYEWSEALAAQLSQGVLVTRVGEGHTGYNKGNVCVDDAIDGFFLEDVVPEDGLRCE